MLFWRLKEVTDFFIRSLGSIIELRFFVVMAGTLGHESAQPVRREKPFYTYLYRLFFL